MINIAAIAESELIVVSTQVMTGLVRAAPFWERGEDWLACRAGVLAALQNAASGAAFARLLWLVEELTCALVSRQILAIF